MLLNLKKIKLQDSSYCIIHFKCVFVCAMSQRKNKELGGLPTHPFAH